MLIAGAVFVVLFSDLVPGLDYHAIILALRRTPASAIVWSIGATALSFAALVGRDACALRYIGARTSFPALLLASFCGSALGNAAGFGALTAAAVRYRVYGAVGIKPDDVARLLLFVMGGFALGLAGVGGLAGLIEVDPVAGLLGWSPQMLRIVAAAAVASAGCVLIFGLRGEFRLGGFSLVAPSKPLAATQLALTSIRLLAAATALWVLLPPMPVGFVTFAAIFSAAAALGVVSHLPGGVGVFELVVLWAFRNRAPSDAVAAALLAYRGVYYVLPLVISAGLFALFEVRVAVTPRRRNSDERLSRVAARLSPIFIGVLTFAAGVMLLVSGATPTFGHRLTILSSHLPIWAVESSHFLGTLIGVVFLFVARGLLDRRDGAWRLAFAFTIASLGFSLAKGLAYGEVGFLSNSWRSPPRDAAAIPSADLDAGSALHHGLVRGRWKSSSQQRSAFCFWRSTMSIWPRAICGNYSISTPRRRARFAPCWALRSSPLGWGWDNCCVRRWGSRRPQARRTLRMLRRSSASKTEATPCWR